MHLLRRLGNRYEPPMHLVLRLRKIASNNTGIIRERHGERSTTPFGSAPITAIVRSRAATARSISCGSTRTDPSGLSRCTEARKLRLSLTDVLAGCISQILKRARLLTHFEARICRRSALCARLLLRFACAAGE